ncbi:hypothetical protein Vadar_026207 [Vaccinium darrowii]|uniref:Uncharacterized protein n=1 Tax=Vaccinium darrowii TaxID=229202 RepID=A0ACB7X3W0_9ERIC|nr:hypothetical protein Vadar_026207 [Vaccinium darrowii]
MDIVSFDRSCLRKKETLGLGASILLAELAKEAGLPDGVLNIVHGTNDIVNAICDDDEIKAISFVGSNTAGMHIYTRASAKGKRVQVCTNIWFTETAAFLLSKHGNNTRFGQSSCTQSNMGAKNHGIVVPDANMDATLNGLVAAGFGAAGQRVDKLVDHAKALKCRNRSQSRPWAKELVFRLIQSGVESGAKLLLDGRNIVVCLCLLFHHCYMSSDSAQLPKADSLEEAINFVNRNKYGNGASIFTTSDVVGRKFQTEIEARQVKTVTQQWKDLPSGFGVSLAMPTSQKSEDDKRCSGFLFGARVMWELFR